MGAAKGSTPWNKGRSKGWLDCQGYWQIKLNGKNVRLHRHLVEQKLGRKLRPDEDVHHVNGNKLDNRVENLVVVDHSEHTIITHKGRRRGGWKLNLSQEERYRRSERMRLRHAKARGEA